MFHDGVAELFRGRCLSFISRLLLVEGGEVWEVSIFLVFSRVGYCLFCSLCLKYNCSNFVFAFL